MEGTLLGIRSIAMSLTIGFDPARPPALEDAARARARLVRSLLAAEWPKGC